MCELLYNYCLLKKKNDNSVFRPGQVRYKCRTIHNSHFNSISMRLLEFVFIDLLLLFLCICCLQSCLSHLSQGTAVAVIVWQVVVGFTTTYASNAYHHLCCKFESRSGRGVQQYVINLSVTFDRSVVFSGYSGFLHQQN